MQHTMRLIAGALFFITGACASTSGCMGSPKTPKKPFKEIGVEFHISSWDGHILEGRVLVHGSYAEHLTIHDAILPFEDVALEKVRACGKTEILLHDTWERQRPLETIELTGLQWHGYDAQFVLFDKMWPWPDCFEADLVVRAADGREAARMPIHVDRTDKCLDTADGGAPTEPKPPVSDGGAP